MHARCPTHLYLIHALVWAGSSEQLPKHNAEAVDIGRFGIWFTRQYLWRHPLPQNDGVWHRRPRQHASGKVALALNTNSSRESHS